MEKILELTQEQFDTFRKSKNQTKLAKKILSLPDNVKIGIGDTAIKVNNSKAFDVFKNTWKGKDNYYILIYLNILFIFNLILPKSIKKKLNFILNI